jgi:exodeoxyribonuclease VII large subunit
MRDGDETFTWELPGEGPAEPEPAQPQDDTLTVPQVAARISALLREGFPRRFWMVGETSGLERTSGQAGGRGHWYFNLVDDAAEDDRNRAQLSVKMWSRTVQRLFGGRGPMADVQPADGVVLRVLVEPDFYAPRGSLSFTIQDVDPEFTLGQLDRQRKELLRKLEQEGALERNKAVPLPEVPLTVGLVSSKGSAAHEDFMEGIRDSGLSFRVVFCDARMQGAETGRTVGAALSTLAATGVDVIALVRGGGSRLDLSWFDKEDVARAVADCDVPVLTGIGHEIDTSVADAASHRAFKTPTAVAEFLARRVGDALASAEDVFDAIRREAELLLDDGRHALLRTASRAQRAVHEGMARATRDLAGLGRRIGQAATEGVALQDRHLAAVRARLGRPQLEALAHAGADLTGVGRRLATTGRGSLGLADQRLGAAEDRLRLLDPARVLQRGYVWLRRADGSALKDAAAAREGEEVTAVVRDGEIDLKTLRARGR